MTTSEEELKAMNNINRLEVIDQTGRAYVHYLSENESVRYSLQDDNRTLKVFIDKVGKQEIQESVVVRYTGG
jgi:hypothetical protein